MIRPAIKPLIRMILQLSAGFLVAANLHAGTPPAPVAVDVVKASSAIHVDAVLDEPAWQAATPIPVNYEWFPGDNSAAPVMTEALVTWDDRYLYVAFRAHDPQPQKIRARFNDRDAATDDDTVGFLIDPFNDKRSAYQFRVNALGVQMDALNSDVEGSEDFSWDAIWESAARLTRDGYVAEIAVPLQQLRFPRLADTGSWGFLAMRDWPRDVRHRFRSIWTDQNRACLVCQFQTLRGLRATAEGRALELTPSVTASSHQERDTLDSPFESRDSTLDAGLTARWRVAPSITLQGTINPDFSQVESDSAQLDVNTRFALFYPEKRPFFLEGSDFFETQLPFVFTRNVADPIAGLKLTGKEGANSFATFLARDQITNLIIPGDQSSSSTSLDESSTDAVLRYRRDIGATSALGGLYTARLGADYSNHLLSTDGLYRFTERDSLRLQVAGSRTDYPQALASETGQPSRSFDGHAIYARYSHSDRNWTTNADYLELSPGFRADSGFLTQVGIRATSISTERRIRGDGHQWFSNLYLSLGVDGTQQYEGGWNEWGSDIGFTYQGPMQSEISFGLAPNQEFFDGVTYHNFRKSLSASFHPGRDLQLGLSARQGETIDFTNSRDAEFVTLSPFATLNIGRHFQGTVTYDRETLNTKSGFRVYRVDLPQATLFYHFNRRAFIRTIVQYQDVELHPEQYVVPVDARDQSLASQLLFSYRIDAQTVFLVGYSDNYLGTSQLDLRQNGRTVFLKLSYAWLL